MASFKQTLCRQLLSGLARCGGLLLLGLCLSQARAAGGSAPAPVPSLTPEAQLVQSVQQWAVRQYSVRPEQVQLVPLDTRLRIQPCQQALAMDLPFASGQTIRVRCPEPVWQVYMRLQNPLPALGGGAAMPATAAQMSPGATELRRSVVVVEQSLARGMTVQAADVRLREVNLPAGGGGYMDNVAEALHSETLRDLPAGTPLRKMDLRPLVLVKRGQLVQMTIGKSSGFMVSVHLEAQQEGRFGEQIKLKNPESGRVLTGVVRGPNLVEGL